jgi:UDPglucose--hexose-1-phosphate uridylyltransferase
MHLADEGQWTILAPARLARPRAADAAVGLPLLCPFCEGHEDQTPPEVFAIRDGSLPNTAGWRVRVVPNRYPALTDADPGNNVAYGRHEVIIERPDHAADIDNLSLGQLTDVMTVYQQRLIALSAYAAVKSVLIFKNCHPAAGASQDHAHAQVLAFPIVPPMLAGLPETDLDATITAADLLVEHSTHHVVYCPPASRFPLEIWIAPRSREPDFRCATPEQLRDLARFVKRALSALRRLIDPLAYNYFLHTTSFTNDSSRQNRWTLKIAPRLEGMGGCELGAGVWINPLPPTWASQQYRKILASIADEK